VAHFLDPVEAKNGKFNDGDKSLKGYCGDGTWEIVVFEANQLFNEVLTKKKAYYESKNIVKAFHLFNGTAISTQSGTITFVLDNNDNSYSSSISKDTKNFKGVDGMGSRRITVPTVGIEDLFARLEILPKDHVILKVDVEGYEYELMRHVYAVGLHALVDVLAVEYHNAGFTDDVRADYSCYQKSLVWLGSDVPGMQQLDWH
jgi:FkbM family methyltransferase